MPFPTLFDDHDKSAFREDTDMFGYRGLTDVKVPGDGVEGQGLTCQQADHGAAGRVGDRLEYIPSCLHMRAFYIQNRLVMQIYI